MLILLKYHFIIRYISVSPPQNTSSTLRGAQLCKHIWPRHVGWGQRRALGVRHKQGPLIPNLWGDVF